MKTNSLMRRFSLLMVVIMILASISVAVFAEDTAADPYANYSKWDGETFDVSPFEGMTANNGNAGYTCDPIIIDSAAKLAGLAKVVNDAKVNGAYGAFWHLPIYITVNIDLGSHDFPLIGYAPDNKTNAMFGGFLEGRLGGVEGAPVTIANLKATETVSVNNAGFICSLRGGSVKNLTFVNAIVGNEKNRYGQGIVIGYASKDCGEISGITVIDSTLICSSVAYNDGHMGSIIGKISKNATGSDFVMKDLHAQNVTISWRGDLAQPAKKNYIGGVFGCLQSQGELIVVDGCSAVNVKLVNPDNEAGVSNADNNKWIGGIVGCVDTAGGAVVNISLQNCHYDSSLAFADKAQNVGAMFGFISHNYNQFVFKNCLITGQLPAGSGLIDELVNGTNFITIENCYATSEVKAVRLNGDAYTAAPNVISGEAGQYLEGFDYENVWMVSGGVNILRTSPTGLVSEVDPMPETPADPETPVEEPVEEVGFFQSIIIAIIAFFKRILAAFGL